MKNGQNVLANWDTYRPRKYELRILTYLLLHLNGVSFCFGFWLHPPVDGMNPVFNVPTFGLSNLFTRSWNLETPMSIYKKNKVRITQACTFRTFVHIPNVFYFFRLIYEPPCILWLTNYKQYQVHTIRWVCARARPIQVCANK